MTDPSSRAKRVMITGASRGIGRAIALRFAREGCDLWLSARSEAALEETCREVSEAGGHATALALDLSSPDSIVTFAEALGSEPLDVLIQNAGAAESAPFGRTDDELLERMLAVNLSGPFRLARALLPKLLESQGAMVCIASTASKTGAPYVSAYAAAKHGLLGWMRSLAHEVATKGVKVNAICPGYVATPMTEATLENIQNKTCMPREQALAALLATTPQKRLIEPAEVAELAHYLTTPAAGGIHGQAIALDGGATMI